MRLTGRRNQMRRRQGVILIVTLWVLVILSSVAMTYAYYARLDLKMTAYSADSSRAKALAKAGYYRACIYLRDDKFKDEDLLDNDDLIELDDDDRGFIYDGLNEEWNSIWFDEDEEDNNFMKKVELGTGTFSVRVTDESGKININYAPLEVIRDLLIVTGMEEEKALALAAAIVDWRDEDQEPSEGGEEGLGDRFSEDTYYNPDQRARDIEDGGPVYVCKNAPFDNVDELLLVFGMTPQILNGEDANHNGKLDPNEQDKGILPPEDDGDDILLLGIRDYVTVYSSKKLNINTAPAKVLEAVFMSYDDSDAENIAEDIIKYRLGSDGEPGTRDDRPFRTIDDSDGDGYHLTEIRSLEDGGLTILMRTMQIGVASDVFTIESIGESGGVQRKMTTVVQRKFTEPLALEGNDPGEDAQSRRLREEEEEEPEAVQFYILRSTEEGI